MKRITLLVLLFAFGFAFAVLSEDLGELAKKEKARREAIEKAGKKAKVFTNADVENLKSQTAMESKSTPQEGEAATPNEDLSYYTPPVEGQDYVSPQEPVQQQTDPAADRRKQMEELENKRDELEQKAKEARENVGAGGLWHSRNTGDQYRIAREAEENAAKVDKQIEDVESKRNQQRQAPAPQQSVVEEYVPPAEEPAETPPAEEPAETDDTTTEEPPSGARK